MKQNTSLNILHKHWQFCRILTPEAEPTAEELLADAEILAEEPNADGDKPLELEDMQLWASMDLDKDGKLTVGEFER